MFRKERGFSPYLIDPKNITKFDCQHWQLELLVLFWVCAAGKNAISASQGLDRFLTAVDGQKSAFAAIRRTDNLAKLMQASGIGCYNAKAITFQQLAESGLNLKTCSLEELEKIKGIGMKTSRCFLIHSRTNAECAGLDTHVLHYLRDLGYDAPKSTPPKKDYLRLEKIFLDLVKKSGQSVAAYDLNIWKSYREKIRA